MKSSKSLLMLIPFLIGGIQTAKSEVIIPANTQLEYGGYMDGSSGRTDVGVRATSDFTTFSQDFSCSSNKFYEGSNSNGAIWACIDALSDSVGSSSSSSSSTDNATTSNLNSLGEGVASSTALTTALTALPQTSKESKLSCGVGTGAYSSKYAVGFGCASKLNERVDVNAGGSYVFGGSKSYGGGTLDNGVLKAGFVFKLGELNKPTQISLNESKKLKTEVKDLKIQNDQLLARLEKLEKLTLALKLNPDTELISLTK